MIAWLALFAAASVSPLSDAIRDAENEVTVSIYSLAERPAVL